MVDINIVALEVVLAAAKQLVPDAKFEIKVRWNCIGLFCYIFEAHGGTRRFAM